MWRKLLWGAVAAFPLLLAACTLTVQPPDGGTVSSSEEQVTPPAPARFVLPSGIVCLYAGTGATVAFDGERANYTCEPALADKTLAILGDPVSPSQTEWQVTLATIGRDAAGFVLDGTEQITFTAYEVNLANGLRCLHAGFGATMGFDGKRLGYTCDKAAAGAMGTDEVGLIGDFLPGDAGLISVELVYFNRTSDGFALVQSEFVPVETFNGQDPTAAPATDLIGPTWEWVETVNSDDTRVTAADPSRYTLTFQPDGQLAAQLDCNRGGGSYTVDGGKLSIGPLMSTLMGCPSDTQDFLFAQGLSGVVAWTVKDGALRLELADGGVMVFRQA